MKGKFTLAAITGFLFGLFSFFILVIIMPEDALLLSVLVGLMFFAVMYPFLFVYEKVISKRYAEIEKQITSPIFCKASGNFNLGNGKIKNGNIYFCEAGIVCVCMEEKPYTLDEILLQDIHHYQFDSTHLNIFTKDERIFVITTADAGKVLELLQEKGWIQGDLQK